MKQSKETIQKRQQQILNAVSQNTIIQVSDISRLLGVSEITIRRDLDYLEKQGNLERFHGGARLLEAESEEIPTFENKGESFVSQKKAIARVIADMIPPDVTVFLNSGSTTLEIIDRIKDRPIRIVTNNALAANVVNNGKAELICTGGVYNDKTCSYTGDLATLLIRKIYADYCILGVNGISSKEGITTYAYQETMLNELMVKRCKGMCIVAADGSKIGRSFHFTSTGLENINVLVTDSSANADELANIQEQGIKVICADQSDSTNL